MKNESGVDTDEVIELYMQDENAPLAPPNPVLCGFQRIRLKAGEEQVFSLPIDPQAFTVVDEEGNRREGSGNWILYAGFGAPDRRTEELTGRKAAAVRVAGPNQ